VRFILFSRPQIFWLLHTNFNFEGEAGYTDEKVCRSRNESAPFESISCIISEIEGRIKACGGFGGILRSEALTAARVHNEDGKEEFIGLSSLGMELLNYCSGWNRRDVCFPFWKEFHMENKKEDILNKPCECGHNRWRTVKKGESWKCRKCGKVRNSEGLLKILDCQEVKC
jgi:hypothetical protein